MCCTQTYCKDAERTITAHAVVWNGNTIHADMDFIIIIWHGSVRDKEMILDGNDMQEVALKKSHHYNIQYIEHQQPVDIDSIQLHIHTLCIQYKVLVKMSQYAKINQN